MNGVLVDREALEKATAALKAAAEAINAVPGRLRDRPDYITHIPCDVACRLVEAAAALALPAPDWRAHADYCAACDERLDEAPSPAHCRFQDGCLARARLSPASEGNGVLVDRELLERLAGHAESLSHADTTHEQRNAAAVDAAAALAALALPAQAAADAAGVLRQAEQATMHYYREVEAICKDDTRRDELPVAKARYRAVEDLYQEMRRALADALEVQG